MSRRLIAAPASCLFTVAIFVGSTCLSGCGGDPNPGQDVSTADVKPGGAPPAGKATKGEAVKSIKNLGGSTPQAK